MWQCLNCKTEIADKYPHCWQCGSKRAPQPTPRTTPQQQPPRNIPVPKFASYEEMAPDKTAWLGRRGPLMRLFWYFVALVAFGVCKVASSPFVGTYGTYILVVIAVAALIIILWRHFRRDKAEGVGIKLN